MMSCGGTSSACWRRSMRTIFWTGANTKIRPGPLASCIRRPREKITPRSYSRRILMQLRKYRTIMTTAARRGMFTTPPTGLSGNSNGFYGTRAPKAKSSGNKGLGNRITHRLHMQHQVFNPADNDFAAGVNIGWRDLVPELAMDKDFACRRERR